MPVRVANRAALLSQGGQARELAVDLAEAALDAVDAQRCTALAIGQIERAGFALSGCTVFALGKAARAMAQSALAVGPRAGVVIGFEDGRLGPLSLHRAGHPVPLDDAERVGREVLELASSLGEGDVALCLISGGGSSMLELPAPGVSLAAIQDVTRRLLLAGADIGQLNAVRRGLSQLKGGRLAAAIRPARIVNVIISDVPGRDLSLVASGPTLEAPSSPRGSEVVRQLGLGDQLDSSVVRALEEEQTVPAFESHTFVAADNATARAAVVRAAATHGRSAVDLPGYLSGTAHEAGRAFVEQARVASADVVVHGGETTVVVRGGGRGGRNQELVLGAFSTLGDGLLASLGTDGIDGASDAAGGLLDAAAVTRARTLGLSPRAALRDNDAERFFEQTGTLLRTGPTGTNVADVCFYLTARTA